MNWIIILVWTILIIFIVYIEVQNIMLLRLLREPDNNKEEEDMSHTQASFLETIKPYVVADMASTQILASLTASQAMIESRSGNSGLATKGNNLFGVKGKYNGQCVNMLTTEYYGGVAHKVYADFRKYPSWAESIADHSALFNRSARYKNLRNCQDYEEACINVKLDGYATSPTYSATLINPIKKYKLWMWDYEVLKHYTPDKLRTVKKGSDGGGVYLLQELLRKNSMSIVADGNFGPATESAVIAYQQAHKLEPDGIVGPQTWREIKK